MSAPTPHFPPCSLPALLLHSLPSSLWTISRTLDSANPQEPSGPISGTATFTRREPTDPCFAGEMLYVEEGEMAMTVPGGHGTATMRFTRRYVWRVAGESDGGKGEDGKGVKGGISVWFVRPGTEKMNLGGEVDYLFHGLDVVGVNAGEESGDEDDRVGDGIWVMEAKGHHLCVDDVYETEYVFTLRFRGGEIRQGGKDGLDGWELERWEVRHRVTGPRKDQRIWSVYEKRKGDG